MPSKNRRAAKPEDKNVRPSYAKPSTILYSMRQKMWFALFCLYFAVDVAALGLVSQQIHKYADNPNDAIWPGIEAGHAMGLLLFSCLFGLLLSIFHWALNLRVYLVLFTASAVFFGSGAGILFETPFGEGLKSGLPVEDFPAAYQPFYGECSRWTAIEGLAWAQFGISIIGFFYALMDQIEMRFTRSDVYDIDVEAQMDEKKPAKKMPVKKLPPMSTTSSASASQPETASTSASTSTY